MRPACSLTDIRGTCCLIIYPDDGGSKFFEMYRAFVFYSEYEITFKHILSYVLLYVMLSTVILTFYTGYTAWTSND